VSIKHDLASKIANCPCCETGLADHSFLLLASDIVGQDPARLIAFFEAIKQRDWEAVIKYQRWDPLSDNVELYGIRCGSSQMALAIIRSAFDLYENDKALAVDCLSQKETEELLTLTKDNRWTVL